MNIHEIKPYLPPFPAFDDRNVPNYMGGRKTYGLIRALCQESGGPYLEVGSYRGASLLAAGDGTGVKCTGIDNFTGVAARLAEAHEKALRANIAGKTNITLIKEDFREAKIRGKFAVIFLDGPHDYQGTLDQLAFAVKRLKKGGCILLDDTNWREVQNAAKDFFNQTTGFELSLWKKTERRTDPDWWNGVMLFKQEP